MAPRRAINRLPYAQFKAAILDLGLPKFQVGVIQSFLFKHGATSFEEMTSVSKAARETLNSKYSIRSSSIADRAVAPDSTAKVLFDWDGTVAEAVYMPMKVGKTLCISVQSGCKLRCSFCATGRMGLNRGLSFGEILDQVIYFMGEGVVSRIVVMGMGESMDNLNELIPALKFIMDPKGFGFSRKRITVSTVGMCPELKRFADSGCGVNLAVSLHATTDSTRNKIVPIGNKYGIKEFLDTAAYYKDRANAKVTIEYLLLKDINDFEEDAIRLGKLSRTYKMPVNIICYNEVDEVPFERSDRLNEFAKILSNKALAVTIRRSKGTGIKAACGQLAGTKIDPISQA